MSHADPTGIPRAAAVAPTVGKKDAARLAATAWARYLDLRDRLRLLREADRAVEWSDREQRRRDGLAPYWDATPESIADLRECGKVVSGVRRSQYKGERAALLQAQLDKDLERLLDKGDASLLQDEPPVLGGFGFASLGKRYNEDTLRYFRVLSLLQDAALLEDCRRQPRRTIWEVAGNWGGLAFQFHSACPQAAYLMTGPAELLLISSVYLGTLFPDARLRVWDPARPDAFWHAWDEVDFAFAPEAAVPALAPPGLLLTLDLGALDQMTPARADAHVRRAYELECRYVFSVCAPGQPDPAQATAVEPVLDRWYWQHPVSTAAGLAKRLALGAARRGAVDRTYRLSWRRLLA